MSRPQIGYHRQAYGVVAILGFACALTTLPAFAQDLAAPGAFGADMLPKGRAAVRLETRETWASEEYNHNGERQALGSNYDGMSLNATVFPALAFFGPGATLGTTDLSAHMTGRQARLTVGYGIGEDVTVGFQVGYGEVVNHVSVSVRPGNVPPGLVSPGAASATEAVQNLLTGATYGYKRVQSSTWHSALDPLVGLRWRFEKGENHATVFAPSLRFGVAKEPDPDDLMQMVLGDGTNDILFGLLHTRKLSEHWDMQLTAQYTVQLADHVTARARSSSELLVPASHRERLRRDRTDPIEFTAETGYSVGAWRWSGRLEYARGGRDHYSSPSGQDVSGLEADSDFHFLLGYLGVSWNGLPAYLRGEQKIPALVSLVAATTLAAKNTMAPDSLYLTLTLPF
ncbi:MAG: hypothetical protein PHD37_02240 [Gallionellaceae bacterium]|nr:hypothetical protein [Gallionellaceae bacterium]